MYDVTPLQTLLTNYQVQLGQLEQALSGNPVVAVQEGPKVEQSLPIESAVTSQERLLLDLFREFATSDEGKALSASLTKFARYVQSQTSK